jgi:hypothetical protein
LSAIRTFLAFSGLLLAACGLGGLIPDGTTFACQTTGECTEGFVCVAGACVPGDGGVIPADAGKPDAGAADAGDAGSSEPDAGMPDAGQPDASVPDSGAPDAGRPDAGHVDAGVPDAGIADAGRPDAGPPADGGFWLYAVGTNTITPTLIIDAGTLTFTVETGDIWDVADDFALYARPLSGSVRITARVTSISPSDYWAKAGVMLRQSPSATSINAMVTMSSANGIVYQDRSIDADLSFSTYSGAPSPDATPVFVRLERSNGMLIASSSADGGTASFVQIFSKPDFLADPFYAGIGVASHNPGVINISTVDSVSVVPLP